MRGSELSSDFQAALELCCRDTYNLDQDFHPDLMIDGGGNIGLFTLRVTLGCESELSELVVASRMDRIDAATDASALFC